MTTNRKTIGSRHLAMLWRLRSLMVRSVVVILFFGLLAVCYTPHQADAADNTVQLSDLGGALPAQRGSAAPIIIESRPGVAHRPKRVNFEQEHPSQETRRMADWVFDSGDNLRMPFVIVDKTNAKVFVFNADGRLRGAAPALLGLARGDNGVPGIGNRKLSDIRPEERTTPAGRFVAALGRNLQGKEILWVDYDGALSLHPVVTNNPKERRLQRLATLTPLDKRISYGCINVPAKFFKNIVRPAFTGTNGVVYVLPDTLFIREVFSSYYDVE